MKKDGYITVYLSLTIAVMLSFIVTIIECVRVQTIRFQTECVMDMGLSSIFAEYNRELLNQYGLFAIDTSYGCADASEERVKSHLLQYMNMNFTAPGQNRIPNYKDLTALHADNAELSKVSYLSDCSGEVLYYQIIQYMKEQIGISYVERIFDEEDSDKYSQLESQWKNNHRKIDSILRKLNKERNEEEEKISIDNPADQIEGMRGRFLLDLVIADAGTILRNQISSSKYISRRSYAEGYGLWEKQNVSTGIRNRMLFQQFLFDKCGYYGNTKEGAALGYQLEYLLYGKDNDVDNLNAFATQVMKTRYVVNAAYLFSSSSKISEAESLAAAITAGIGNPALTEAVKMTILFAWCYAESIQDLRIMFDGKQAAKIKTDSTWNIPLKELLMFTSRLDSYKEAEGGKTYEDYLSQFLFLKEESTKCMRLMDIMEMDIQKKSGNQYFQMDTCIYQLETEVNVSSKYGYGYSIARDYSYE